MRLHHFLNIYFPKDEKKGKKELHEFLLRYKLATIKTAI